MKKQHWLLFILLGLYSCDSNRAYESHQDVRDVLNWARDDKKTYSFDVPDISQKYNIAIALRHHSGIQRGNIKVNFTIISPDGKKNMRKHILPIRDDKGQLVGSAGGDLCDTENYILNEYQFKATGKHTFTIEHAMEDDDLASMIEIGLIIDKMIEEEK